MQTLSKERLLASEGLHEFLSTASGTQEHSAICPKQIQMLYVKITTKQAEKVQFFSSLLPTNPYSSNEAQEMT